MPVYLVIKRGPDKGKKISIEKDEMVIGRDRSADIALNDQTISRGHCRLCVNDGNYYIEDLQSKNKTIINGRVLEPEVKHPLGCDDEVTIGETVFCIKNESYNENIKLKIKNEAANKTKAMISTGNISCFSSHNAQTLIIEKDNVTVEKVVNNLELIYKVNSAIHSIRDKNLLIKTLLELIFAVIPADRGAILLYDSNTKKLVPEVALSRNIESSEDIHVSVTIANQVFKDKIGIITTDAINDSRFADKQTIIRNSVKSAMCVPIGTINNMLGVIQLESPVHSGIFTEKDLDLLSVIANQAAIAIENNQFYQKLNDENQQLQKALQKEYDMVGKSTQMQKIFETIQRLSNIDSTILIRGESGTGKELVARAVHYTSTRKDKAFVCVNCAALNKNLLESELFGHEKGAFTGAMAQKKGRFELANEGTIFLDEIGELTLESQVKLLRVLEERKFERVGGTQSISTNVRIITATNRDLEEAIREKTFREDLYFRLNVIQIDMPPLRERRDDIVVLALFFLEKYREKLAKQILQFAPESLELLKSYQWPGNVRELKNCIERAVVLGNSNIILPEDLVFNHNFMYKYDKDMEFPTLQQVEREHIIKALNSTDWNKKKTADILGIQRSTLYEKMKVYNIAL